MNHNLKVASTLLSAALACSTALVTAASAPHQDEDPEFRFLQSDHSDHGGDHSDHGDHGDHNELGSTSDTPDDDKPWGAVIGAAIIINLVTLIGVVFLVGACISKKLRNGAPKPKGSFNWKFSHNIIPSFACGAILATSVYLIIPESLLMITDAITADPERYGASIHEEEGGEGDDAHAGHNHRWLEDHDDDGHEAHYDIDVPVAWRFGTCILGGFLFPIVTGLIFPHYHEPEVCEKCQGAMRNGVLVSEEEAEEEDSTPLSSRKDTLNNTTENTVGASDALTASNGDDGCEVEGCCDVCKDHESVENNENDLEAAPIVTVPEDSDALERTKSIKDVHINYTLAASVLLGDVCHNFTDGVFIGTAFLLCDRQLAITISAATIYHELAQEIADYFLLTKHCNLSPIMALTLNFVCGLSVLIGAIVVLSVDVSLMATGCILSAGAGVYIYVAGGECFPRARDSQTTTQDKLISLASFVLGAVPIGLVLLNHFHCEAGGHDDGHGH